MGFCLKLVKMAASACCLAVRITHIDVSEVEFSILPSEFLSDVFFGVFHCFFLFFTGLAAARRPVAGAQVSDTWHRMCMLILI